MQYRKRARSSLSAAAVICLVSTIFGILPTTVRASVIVSDTFFGAGNGSVLTGRTPEITLPGGGWLSTSGQGPLKSTTTAGYGDPLPGAFSDFNDASALSIASAGSYVKPTTLRISADIAPRNTTGAASGGRGVAVGFYSAVSGNTFSQNRFTGLVLDAAGNLNLVQDPNAGGFFDPGSFLGTPVSFTGTWNANTLRRLTYDVDTTTGAISNISLEGSSSTYTYSTSLFTNAATAYAGAYGSSSTSGPTSALDNFIVTEVEQFPNWIQDVTIEGVSSQFSGRLAVDTINGTGFNGATGIHDNSPTNMWLTNGTATGQITYDLGDVYDLDSLNVWNYNEVPGVALFSQRSARDVTISVASSEGGPFASLGNFVFEMAPGIDSNFGQFIDLSAFSLAGNVRLVRFDITSNYDGDNYVGLSEVRFSGTLVPEPKNLALTAVALLGLIGAICYRRREKRTSHEVKQ